MGTRAHVLALVPGRKYTTELKGDLKWLLDAVYQRGSENPGCYTYQSPGKDAKSGNWDNSNSQFGVLGVWMAAEAGLEVPAWYWEIVAEHWITCQTKEGGWGYLRDQPPTGSMTAAGLTALFVALDQRYAGRPQEAGGLISAIDAGLTWLARKHGMTTRFIELASRSGAITTSTASSAPGARAGASISARKTGSARGPRICSTINGRTWPGRAAGP